MLLHPDYVPCQYRFICTILVSQSYSTSLQFIPSQGLLILKWLHEIITLFITWFAKFVNWDILFPNIYQYINIMGLITKSKILFYISRYSCPYHFDLTLNIVAMSKSHRGYFWLYIDWLNPIHFLQCALHRSQIM